MPHIELLPIPEILKNASIFIFLAMRTRLPLHIHGLELVVRHLDFTSTRVRRLHGQKQKKKPKLLKETPHGCSELLALFGLVLEDLVRNVVDRLVPNRQVEILAGCSFPATPQSWVWNVLLVRNWLRLVFPHA